VIAQCSVTYEGRLTAYLPSAVRLLMVKADGCVAIHADGGAYKPLNWMNSPNYLEETDGLWIVSNKQGERLEIKIEEVLHEFHHEMGIDPGLVKDGVEAHLQVLLAERPGEIEEGLSLIRREFPTDIGPVDLFCNTADGDSVAIEIKRQGGIDGVEQLGRYLERMNLDARLAPVRGIFVAQSISPQAKVIAEARGIECVEVDYDELRGIESNVPRLF
jgi:RecB family endonuclease NucS